MKCIVLGSEQDPSRGLVCARKQRRCSEWPCLRGLKLRGIRLDHATPSFLPYKKRLHGSCFIRGWKREDFRQFRAERPYGHGAPGKGNTYNVVIREETLDRIKFTSPFPLLNRRLGNV